MKRKWILILSIILIALFIVSLFIGRFDFSFKDIINIITFNDTSIKSKVFLKIRLPRVLFVIIAGAGLSLAGFIYQTIFKNPLASPDILGVASGASIGAILGILFFSSNRIIITILSFILGVFVVILAFLLAKVMKGDKLYNLVLSGIIISAIANSIIMFLKYQADSDNTLQQIDYWLMGSFHSIVWQDFLIMTPITITSIILLLLLNRRIKYLTLNDDEVISLGINVKLLRFISLILSTLIVTSIVSIVGVISFIGLIVPHICKMLFKENYFLNMIESLLVGAIILLIADDISRSISDSELPISIFTSFIGAISLFLFMSWRKKYASD